MYILNKNLKVPSRKNRQKNSLEECLFVNSAFKIQCHVPKNTLHQTAFSVKFRYSKPRISERVKIKFRSYSNVFYNAMNNEHKNRNLKSTDFFYKNYFYENHDISNS